MNAAGNLKPARNQDHLTTRRMPFMSQQMVPGEPKLPVDSVSQTSDNWSMSTDTRSSVDPDTAAILERMATGKPHAPEVYRRIREEGAKTTEEIRRKHGLLNIAVDLIREARDET